MARLCAQLELGAHIAFDLFATRPSCACKQSPIARPSVPSCRRPLFLPCALTGAAVAASFSKTRQRVLFRGAERKRGSPRSWRTPARSEPSAHQEGPWHRSEGRRRTAGLSRGRSKPHSCWRGPTRHPPPQQAPWRARGTGQRLSGSTASFWASTSARRWDSSSMHCYWRTRPSRHCPCEPCLMRRQLSACSVGYALCKLLSSMPRAECACCVPGFPGYSTCTGLSSLPASQPEQLSCWPLPSCCSGMLIVGIVGLVSVIVGLLGSLRANCCVTLYLWLGSLLTLGAPGWQRVGRLAVGACRPLASALDNDSNVVVQPSTKRLCTAPHAQHA